MAMYGKIGGFFALAAICALYQTAVAATRAIDSAKSPALEALPPARGSFAVGKITIQLTDGSRIEPLSANHQTREMMVDIWYPAEPLHLRLITWTPRHMKRRSAQT